MREPREESLNIKNVKLLIRFDKTREIFYSITQVLSIFLTTAATSANAERAYSKLLKLYFFFYKILKLYFDLQNKSIDWFLYDRCFGHERTNTLLLAYIDQVLFLDYDKLIDT